ncbi:MAG: tetratricopeptide repeat protein [Sandaracinus sp.]|nr:tetratricopeptide repeat protein [Myxococcales bacterium]MCB9600198.1 tetratricopeptide repeat protein [Sandaracinus sp.]MCB9630834.1 tetratricopeptide repeat protein [Sandaracinus sp.]
MSATFPDEALEAARWLARRAERRGRLDLSKRILVGCLHARPDASEAARDLARVALALGDPATAQHAAGIALQHDARHPHAAWLYARALIALGATEDARGWLALAANDPALADVARAVQARLSR